MVTEVIDRISKSTTAGLVGRVRRKKVMIEDEETVQEVQGIEWFPIKVNFFCQVGQAGGKVGTGEQNDERLFVL